MNIQQIEKHLDEKFAQFVRGEISYTDLKIAAKQAYELARKAALSTSPL